MQRCPDLQTLRQWIVDKRISRDDEISLSEKKWRRLGSVVEFESLFYSVEAEIAQRRKAASKSGSQAATRPPDAQRSRTETPPAFGVASASGSGAQVRVTPAGSASSGDAMSPMRLTPPESKAVPAGKPAAKTEGKPEAKAAAPGMAGSVQAALRASQPKTETVEPTAKTPPREPPPAMARPVTPTPPAGEAKVEAKPEAKPPAKPEAKPEVKTPAAAAAKAPTSGKPATPPARPAPTSGKPATPAAANVGETSVPAAAERKSAARADSKIEVSDALDESLSSGNQTAVFKRGESDAKSGRSGRADGSRRDEIEAAILKNDPVPRHLQEDTGDNTVKFPSRRSADMTERVEGRSSGRGFWMATLGIGAIVAFGLYQYSQSNTTTTPQSGGDTQVTQPAGSSGTPSTGTGDSNTGSTGSTGTTGTPGSEPMTATPPATAKPEGPKTATPPATNPPATTGTSPGTVTPPATTGTSPAPTGKPAATGTAGPGTNPVTATPAPPAKPNPPATSTATPAPATTPGTGTPAAPTATSPKPTPAATGTSPATTGTQPATTPAAAGTAPGPVARPKIDGNDLPKTFDEQMELAQKLLDKNRFEDAQKIYEFMLTFASSVPAIHVGLGTCAFERGRLDEAAKHYQDALTRAPNYSHAIFGLAKTFRAKNDTAQALVYYKQYVEKYPKRPESAIARDFIAKSEGGGDATQKPPEKPAQP